MTPERRRRLAVGLAGFCTFLNLYAPQSVLPVWMHEFGVGAAKVSMAITASTLAVAIIAPFAGAVADVLGRRRVITAAMFLLVVPTAMVAFAPDIDTLIGWRFVQGLVLPPIFAVTVAYIAEEWPAAQAVGITGLYTSAAGFGGFFGRFFSGVAADVVGWRYAFFCLAVLTLALALAVSAWLPRERHFVSSDGLSMAARQMVGHLANARLVATYLVGFGVLFTFVAVFTYVNFHLAAAPFNLSPALLGAIFVVYLAGSAASPLTGRLVSRFGRRELALRVIVIWIAGLMLTLIPSLPVIVLGLAIAAACGFLCQAMSTSFVATTARHGHSSAVGLYVTFYYVGGTLGGLLTGLVWNRAGWPGCVGVVIGVLLLMGLVVHVSWRPPRAA
jgi:MFS transporter, YNFM family, putative membrane transport protein